MFDNINKKLDDYSFEIISGDEFLDQGNQCFSTKKYSLALTHFKNAINSYQRAFNIAHELSIPVDDVCKKIGEAGSAYKNTLNILGKERYM